MIRPRGPSRVQPLHDGVRTLGTMLCMVTFFSLAWGLRFPSGAVHGANRLMLNPQFGVSVGSLLIILTLMKGEAPSHPRYRESQTTTFSVTGALVFLFGRIADQVANIRLEERRHRLSRRVRAEDDPFP